MTPTTPPFDPSRLSSSGSGLTIAGATYCLSFARLPYFTTMGAPVAIGMIVVVAIAVTLGPGRSLPR